MDWYLNTEWRNEKKGLRKQVLDFRFKSFDKPQQLAKVKFIVTNIQKPNDCLTKLLPSEQIEMEQELEFGTSLTPIDCYIELLLRQMVVGERALCSISTKEKGNITFEMTLKEIQYTRALHTLKVDEMFSLALSYKENGVAMFKNFPLFAQHYFSRASKCLISYKPFTHLTFQQDGVDGREMQELFIKIQTNLAACLLLQQRYEDVIYQTSFVEIESTAPSEKSIYRRAMAYLHCKNYEAALNTIERLPNFQDKKEFVKLRQRITECSKSSNVDYKNIVKRMFS